MVYYVSPTSDQLDWDEDGQIIAKIREHVRHRRRSNSFHLN
jgi:hypothetical protein